MQALELATRQHHLQFRRNLQQFDAPLGVHPRQQHQLQLPFRGAIDGGLIQAKQQHGLGAARGFCQATDRRGFCIERQRAARHQLITQPQAPQDPGEGQAQSPDDAGAATEVGPGPHGLLQRNAR